MVNILTDKQVNDLKKSGDILSAAVKETASFVKPGITTMSLNDVAEKSLRRQGAVPSFKNYLVKGSGRFPQALCISINDELVHGIPSVNRVLKTGDIVSLDLGANFRGLFTDMAITLPVGKISEARSKLINITKKVLDYAILQLKPQMLTGDFGNIIEKYITSNGYCVIKSLVGHGIGLKPHDEPQIPNFGHKGEGVKLLPSTAIAIEPMVAVGDNAVKTSSDGWTIKMKNGQDCAHFEHTVLITEKGIVKITKY